MRCMFPYKQFAEAEAESSKKAAEVESTLTAATSTSHCAPKDGNEHQNMTKWTRFEHQNFQAVLLQCSRWEVAYTNNFIKSTKCAVQMSNPDSICIFGWFTSPCNPKGPSPHNHCIMHFHLLFTRKTRKLAFLLMPIKCYLIIDNTMLPITTCVPSRVVSCKINLQTPFSLISMSCSKLGSLKILSFNSSSKPKEVNWRPMSNFLMYAKFSLTVYAAITREMQSSSMEYGT